MSSLLDTMLGAKTWALACVRNMDTDTRSAFAQASGQCHALVQEAAQQAVVLLPAHTGLSSAVWQARVDSAQQTLAVRGQQHPMSMIVKLPAPYPAALPSVLSMSETARQAIAELSVVQSQPTERPMRETTPCCISSMWLQQLPSAIPHLRRLSLGRLDVCLPAPRLLPHLKELTVHLHPHTNLATATSIDTAAILQPIWASIAPYTAQLTSLYVGTRQGVGMPWSDLFPSPSETITRFGSPNALTDVVGLPRAAVAESPTTDLPAV